MTRLIPQHPLHAYNGPPGLVRRPVIINRVYIHPRCAVLMMIHPPSQHIRHTHRHDAGTFCAKSNTGGANGSIRFTPESGHGANAGLQFAFDKMQEIKDKVPEISYADLYQLASVVAVEYAGGPVVPFRYVFF